MGNVLLIKNADFSENAVPVESIYDIVLQTDTEAATPSYPMVTGLDWYHDPALVHSIDIYAVTFVVQSGIGEIDPTKNSSIMVGASDGSTVLRSVNTSVADVVSGFVAGSKQTILLSTPVRINAGEYVTFGNGSGNKICCYARTASGNYGTMKQIDVGDTTSYNFAATFYGVEVEED